MTETAVSDHLKKNYADYYAEGDSEWRWLGALDKAENVIALCSATPHRTVLEVGAGEGSVLKRLSDRGFGEELYALEISPTGIQTIVNKQIPQLKECRLFDGYDIPYENKKFDLAILSHVIEHVEHPRKLLYDAARVARYVFVEVPLEETARMKPDFVFDKVGHINVFTPKTIRWLLQTCPLEVLDQMVTIPSKAVYLYRNRSWGGAHYYIKANLLKIFPRLATSLFTYHSALVSRSL
jgi:ubiquinone/menaquinone biosynthesis C-methylase UbiE